MRPPGNRLHLGSIHSLPRLRLWSIHSFAGTVVLEKHSCTATAIPKAHSFTDTDPKSNSRPSPNKRTSIRSTVDSDYPKGYSLTWREQVRPLYNVHPTTFTPHPSPLSPPTVSSHTHAAAQQSEVGLPLSPSRSSQHLTFVAGVVIRSRLHLDIHSSSATTGRLPKSPKHTRPLAAPPRRTPPSPPPPGRARKIKSLELADRYKDYVREPAVPAYLLYTDVGEFRRYLLSFPVLEAFVMWKDKANACSELKHAIILIILEHADSRDSMYPADLDKALVKYGTQDIEGTAESLKRLEDSRQQCLLACLLRFLVHSSEGLLQQEDEAKTEAQNSATVKFESLTGRRIPSSHDILEVVDGPFWGPSTRLDEHEAEAYNRAYAVLQRLKQVTVKARWESAYFPKKKDPFVATRVPADTVPTWMLLREGEDEIFNGPANGFVGPRPVLSPLKFRLVEKTTLSGAKRLQIAHFKRRGAMPAGPSGLSHQGRMVGCSPHGPGLRAQTSSILYRGPRFDSGFGLPRLQSLMSLFVDWDGFKKSLDQDRPMEATIMFNVQPLDEGEFPLEFIGVPIQLSNLVELEEDGDFRRQ
ncbi:uncharacterized protein J3D65DRAFT_689933 [Phyllosticta citribraziliensis]|uniref:Uncharacterized protein n=1 Tax=Phyllosticta citribraziliensis TaxID=989973 RepID=A0ABR1M4X7_9PEZI